MVEAKMHIGGTQRNGIATIPVLIEDDGPRVLDIELGQRLGMARPRKIREIISRNMAEIESFGVCPAVGQTHGPKGGRPTLEYYLNEEQALLVATLSGAPNAPAVRAMLIRTFTALRRGETAAVLDLPAEIRKVLGGMIKSNTRVVIHDELAEILPQMVRSQLSQQNMMIRTGKTAGQIWNSHGFPKLKGAASWFGNRLQEMNCRIENNGCGELGSMTARLFDPDRAELWLKNGGRAAIEQKIAERRGQGRLRLVSA